MDIKDLVVGAQYALVKRPGHVGDLVYYRGPLRASTAYAQVSDKPTSRPATVSVQSLYTVDEAKRLADEFVAAKAAKAAEKAAKTTEPSARDQAREHWGKRIGEISSVRTITHEDDSEGCYVGLTLSWDDFLALREAIAEADGDKAAYPKAKKKEKAAEGEAPAEQPAQ